jgi:putative flippase GtrA
MVDILNMTAIKYIMFAIISTLINLIFQYFSLGVYSGFMSLYIAMFIGTFAGLITKYILDKKFIFYRTIKDKKNNIKTFIFYSFTGVFTTIIFWGTEIIFDILYNNPDAKYFGAVLGLTIGYMIKYYLDNRFVFKIKKGTI